MPLPGLSTATCAQPKRSGPSHCWICGRFGVGNPYTVRRECRRCGVCWNDPAPGVNHDSIERARQAELAANRASCAMRKDGWEWDQFDNFIDHGLAHIPSPA